MLKVPSAALDVIIMTNRHDVSAVSLASAILDCCLSDLESMESAEPEPARIGVYRSHNTGRVVQLQSRDNRQIILIDGFEIPVTRRADCLVPAGNRSYLKYEFRFEGDQMSPSMVRLLDFGNEDRLYPLPGEGPNDAARLVGRFRSGECHADVSIELVERELHLSVSGPFGAPTYRLAPVGRDVWQLISTGSILAPGLLSLNESGSELRFSSWRLRAHRFVRSA